MSQPTPSPETTRAVAKTDREQGTGAARYVAGFMFSPDLRDVAVIRKQKPDWQRGKLNGIGGSIEPGENPLAAMVREFQEETGFQCTSEKWKHFLLMEGANDDGGEFSVDFFCTRGMLDELTSATQEEVITLEVGTVWPGRSDMIENLPWLIALAVDHLQDGRPYFAHVEYRGKAAL